MVCKLRNHCWKEFQELDLMIHVGSFQLGIFCENLKLLLITLRDSQLGQWGNNDSNVSWFGRRAQTGSKAFQIHSNICSIRNWAVSSVSSFASHIQGISSEFVSRNIWTLVTDFLNMIFRYLVFYCPQDKFYQCFAFLPLRLLVAGMKEVTRTWKIVAGVAHADSHFEDAWLVMIAVGWARGNMHNIFFWWVMIFWSGI